MSHNAQSMHRGRRQGLSRRAILQGIVGLTALGAPARVRAASSTELLIGWLKPMTGPLASSFAPLYIAADIALEEINQSGGILGRKLVKVEVDDQASPAQQPIAIQRLIEQGASIILGPVGSSQAVASLEISTARKLIQATYATADEVGDGQRYPYHYQFNFTSRAQVTRHVEYLQKLGVTEVGVLVEDSAAGASSRNAMLTELPARGLKIVSEQTFPIRVTDMTPFLRKLRSDGAKAIDTHVSNNIDVTQLLVGLNRISWKPAVVGHTGLLFAGTPGAIPDAARYDQILAATFRRLTYTDSDLPSERIRTFAKKILASNVPDSLLGPAATTPFYDFLHALKAGAERAKSVEPEAIKAALDSSSALEGLFGPMSFTASNHSAYGPDVIAMAVANSMEEPLSKEYRGLLRRRGPAVA